jgi:hypothetical protein
MLISRLNFAPLSASPGVIKGLMLPLGSLSEGRGESQTSKAPDIVLHKNSIIKTHGPLSDFPTLAAFSIKPPFYHLESGE